MELYKQIKIDLSLIIIIYVLVHILSNYLQLDFDSTDNKLTNTRSGIKLYTDYGTGIEYIRIADTVFQRKETK